MFKVDPKINLFVALAVAILGAISSGTVVLPLGIPPEWGQYIVSWDTLLIKCYILTQPILIAFGINFANAQAPVMAVDQGFAVRPNPSEPTQVKQVAKALAFIVMLCLVAFHVKPALADPDSMPIRPEPILRHLPNKAPALTGNIAKDVATAAAGIAGDTPDKTTGDVLSHILVPDLIADLTAAQAVYTALHDDAGAACNQSILTQIQAFQKAVSDNPLPKVHLAYDFAVIRSLLLGIQPNSPIYNNCATIATQTGQTVLQFATGIITGATSILPAVAVLAQ